MSAEATELFRDVRTFCLALLIAVGEAVVVGDDVALGAQAPTLLFCALGVGPETFALGEGRHALSGKIAGLLQAIRGVGGGAVEVGVTVVATALLIALVDPVRAVGQAEIAGVGVDTVVGLESGDGLVHKFVAVDVGTDVVGAFKLG